MDDEPMWAADHVVTLTPGSAITIPETANEFTIKDTENEDVRLMMFPLSLTREAKKWLDELNKGTIKTLNDITQEVLNAVAGGIFLYKTLNQAYQLLEDKVLLKLDWAKNQKTKPSLKITVAFADEATTKNHQASIQNLEAKFNRLADKQSGRPSGSIHSNTQPNLKGSSSKPYQPPQSCNEHVNSILTRSGKSYNPPVNQNDQPNISETSINFVSDDEDDEPTPQPKPKEAKPVKETPIPKPYKPKIPYPQCLRKEKMEAQYGKFLYMIRAVRIKVPLVDVLFEMPND
ncbi:hypothetical protein Tco_0763711 [Tanacetum coccineum]